VRSKSGLQIKAKIPELVRRRIIAGYSQRELARKTPFCQKIKKDMSPSRGTCPFAILLLVAVVAVTATCNASFISRFNNSEAYILHHVLVEHGRDDVMIG
jgi:hypothetical protein